MPRPSTVLVSCVVETKIAWTVERYPIVPRPVSVEFIFSVVISPIPPVPPTMVEINPAVPSPATVLARGGPNGKFVS